MSSFSSTINNTYTHTSHFVGNCVHVAGENLYSTGLAVSRKCRQTAEAIHAFVSEHSGKIFFIACTCAAAYFTPQVFFPAAVIAIILRVEFKELMNEFIKDNHNPYFPNPKFGPHYISAMDYTLGAIGGAHALALGTVFTTNSLAVTLIPALAGIAAGNCIAKIGMDVVEYFYPSHRSLVA
ncbi:hypothetical protein [Candidatus Protochlamydia phocaeensis]|uniref:hypothetical protein n=1 Tax=Candidatus Protochlamydia phocaeensis TaxID=1414722 RepID=UPI0008390796|nr:hypothetical protein [Candidatus Protochlamydia phocaeensis]